MRVELINPFVEATKGAFETMVGLVASPGKPWIRQAGGEKNAAVSGDVCAVIGLSGSARGTVVLSFDMASARRVVARFSGLGDAVAELSDSDVSDGVGELVNMVAGAAKAELNKRFGSSLSLSIPSVVIGSQLGVHPPSGIPALVVPFELDGGRFHLEVSMSDG